MGLSDLWHRLRTSRTVHRATHLLPGAARPLPDGLWQATLDAYPFLHTRPEAEVAQLRLLSSHFLGGKEFHGAEGLVVTDAMAIAIAAQRPACRCCTLAHRPRRWPGTAILWASWCTPVKWWPGAKPWRRGCGALLRRSAQWRGDGTWPGHAQLARRGPGGCQRAGRLQRWWCTSSSTKSTCVTANPTVAPLAARLHGQHQRPRSTRRMVCGAAARVRQIPRAGHHRRAFGGAQPWLDAYGAESISEFFPVACEAYFVNRSRFGADFATLLPLFDAFFVRHTQA